MMIDDKALIHLESMLDIQEPSQPIGPDYPACLECKEKLEFTEHATDTIAFKRMCTVTQTVFSCPACGCRMVIFSKGTVPYDSTEEGDLAVGPPTEGFHIAKVA